MSSLDEIMGSIKERMLELRPAHEEYLRLERMIGEHERVRTPALTSVQPLVLEVLERAPGGMRSKSIHSVLVARGHALTADQVSNALGYCLRSGLVERLGRGTYKMREEES